MFARTALGGIWFYQTYLSPRKGFHCAYSMRHGGTGCSGFAKFAIREYGFLGAIAPIKQRFRACKQASLALRQTCTVHANQSDPNGTNPRRKKRKANVSGWLDACGFGCCAGSTSANTTRAPDAASDGCGGITDIGGCDCTPDCSCSPSCG